MKKRQYKKNYSVNRTLKKVTKNLRRMSPKEFAELLKEHEPTCMPETCHGECQGTGWCKMAVDFRKNIVPQIIKEEYEKNMA